MFHQLLVAWFQFVEQWGYWGVFFLMALESSIVPIPSEVVLPPAAFWAAQGRMDFWGVVLAGTAGSYLGSIVNYWAARWLGAPVLHRYGKYILIPEKKVKMAEHWVAEYGVGGIFLARLLPVIRHLISIPAGILSMPLGRFTGATVSGAFMWCLVLSWFGQKVLGDQPNLLSSPEAMVAACRAKLGWFVIGVVGLAASYALVLVMRRENSVRRSGSPRAPG